MKPILSFKSVSKSFDGSTVLDNIDLDIESGHFYTLLGPSGCGKTTILKLVAGFEQTDHGEIVYKDQVINDLPANEGSVHTVF